MALTPTVQFKTVFGNQRVVLGTLAFDASYPTGGEATTIAALGDSFFADTDGVAVMIFPNTGYTFQWHPDTLKVRALSTAATEVSNATDLSALSSVTYLMIGN